MSGERERERGAEARIQNEQKLLPQQIRALMGKESTVNSLHYSLSLRLSGHSVATHDV